MIEAGVEALLCELGGSVDRHWSAPDLAVSVYQAMTAAFDQTERHSVPSRNRTKR
jgi:hypothetical protein